jgi:hypothetical protein
LKLFKICCVFLYCSYHVHRYFLITLYFPTLIVPVTATLYTQLITVRHNHVEIYTEFQGHRSRNVGSRLQSDSPPLALNTLSRCTCNSWCWTVSSQMVSSGHHLAERSVMKTRQTAWLLLLGHTWTGGGRCTCKAHFFSTA